MNCTADTLAKSTLRQQGCRVAPAQLYWHPPGCCSAPTRDDHFAPAKRVTLQRLHCAGTCRGGSFHLPRCCSALIVLLPHCYSKCLKYVLNLTMNWHFVQTSQMFCHLQYLKCNKILLNHVQAQILWQMTKHNQLKCIQIRYTLRCVIYVFNYIALTVLTFCLNISKCADISNILHQWYVVQIHSDMISCLLKADQIKQMLQCAWMYPNVGPVAWTSSCQTKK